MHLASIAVVLLAGIAGAAEAQRKPEVLWKMSATHVKIVRVVPATLESGITASYIYFDGIVRNGATPGDRLVSFREIFQSDEATPNPEVGDVCDINWRLERDEPAGLYNTVDRKTCRSDQ